MNYEITNLNHNLSPLEALFDFGLDHHFERSWRPKVDIDEVEDHWELRVDVPGVAKENIKVDVAQGQLIISGERESKKDENGYRERSYGRFERRFNLPDGTDSSKIKASCNDGVLKLEIPKEEKAKPTSIAIDVQ